MIRPSSAALDTQLSSIYWHRGNLQVSTAVTHVHTSWRPSGLTGVTSQGLSWLCHHRGSPEAGTGHTQPCTHLQGLLWCSGTFTELGCLQTSQAPCLRPGSVPAAQTAHGAHTGAGQG